MRTYIKVNAELRNDLMSIFSLSRMSIWKALNGLTNSEKSNQVRQYAIDHGGRYVREDFVPACKTVHHEDGSFIQQFAGGVSVQVTPKEALVTIIRDEVELESFKDATLNDWGNILRLAQAYADGTADSIAN